MKYALKVSEKDNVVTVLSQVKKGETVSYLDNKEKREVVAQNDIPIYHKIATCDIKTDEDIVKYGENIGRASVDIAKGSHVHTHNVKAHRENLEEKEWGDKLRTFWGYRREDGRVGIRNHVLILPASICASDTTRLIASNLNGAVTFNLQLGCSQVGQDFELTLDTLAGYGANPNVYGVIIVGLGCETAQASLVKEKILERTKKPIETLVIQEEGGTLKTIAKAQSLAKKMIGEAALVKREEFPLSELILGTNCGGSDTTSGIAANPTIGEVSDKLVAMGGTSVLCETTEFIGAEHILARRAKNKEVHDKLYEIINNYEEKIKHDTGLDVRDGNPSPGNIEGGLTTLEEKSLGCIHKGGSSIINNIYDYSKQIKGKEGLVIMDTPGNDASSVGGIIAGGCQLVVFSTGRGTPTGHAIAPVIKITGNSETYARMSDNIDYDASKIITENKSIEQASEELLDLIVDVCNGKLVQAELLGYTETAIQRASAFV